MKKNVILLFFFTILQCTTYIPININLLPFLPGSVKQKEITTSVGIVYVPSVGTIDLPVPGQRIPLNGVDINLGNEDIPDVIDEAEIFFYYDIQIKPETTQLTLQGILDIDIYLGPGETDHLWVSDYRIDFPSQNVSTETTFEYIIPLNEKQIDALLDHNIKIGFRIYETELSIGNNSGTLQPFEGLILNMTELRVKGNTDPNLK